MTPERWQRVEELYHLALEKEPGGRAAFLGEKCGNDPELRREVESLLGTNGSALERPLWGTTATGMQIHPGVTPGSQLGPYRIEATLGAGGMGEVFRATDTRLHRIVAIKILPRDKVADPERKRRFLQEARAASALNHPNIVVLHDIASDNGIDYLVMEHVAGKSLDKLIPPKGLPLGEGIDYATQIAGALAAAHAGGIVHRDIKPANVMITAENQVKVLDFGLAKLAQNTTDSKADTALTRAGMAMGTLSYMSPEQARGEEVDARTDLFSFGALLYEIASGRKAFPKPLDWSTPPTDPLPPELRPIVLKLIRPDRDQRYQQSTEVRTDLQRLGQSAPLPARSAGRWKGLVTAAAAIALLAGAGTFFLRGAPRLTDKDTVVIADFDNKTGDPVFDDTLRQGLSVQLEQSPFLSLIGDQRIQQILGMMGQPKDVRLTPAIAKEVCERAGGGAVIQGSVAALGTRYVVGLRAISCRTGSTLADQQVQAAREEDVLNALSQVAGKFRSRLGESMATVQKHNTPLEEATTRSLDALKAYSTGVKIWYSKGPSAAEPHFQRAIEIDPDFAMAHAFLGRVHSELYEPGQAAESAARAYQLRDHVSDPERFFIMVPHDLDVTGNLEHAEQTAESWAENYPRDVRPRGYLSWIDQQQGKFEKSVEDGKKAVALDPAFPPAFGNLAWAYLQLNRLPETENTILEAGKYKSADAEFLVMKCYIDFLRGDQAAFDKEAAKDEGNPDVGDWVIHAESAVLAFSGHVRKARMKSRQAVDATRRDPHKTERAAMWEAGAAVREAFFGNAGEARVHANAALSFSKGRDVEYGAALAFALIGDTTRSEALAKDLQKSTEDSLVRFDYTPTLQALWAIERGDSANALDELQASVPYELSMGPAATGLYGILYPVYARGQAYLMARQYTEAIAEFRRVLAYPSLIVADPVGVMARLQLARALAKSGDEAKAGAAYQDFLTLWKDADPDVPILRQAKAEYAKLKL
jgi:serine/threonine protein kinase/tetratricopeptide (TPR) repeat protein